MVIIIMIISGIMWLNGVIWTLSTLLFSKFRINILLIKIYFKSCLLCFYDLPAMFYSNWGVPVVQQSLHAVHFR